LSLCTGYGGIERGLELAGIKHRVVAHVEIEAFAIANLVAKMEQGRMVPAPIWTDLKTLPVDCFRDRVDIITGGYPCQPFSAAGKRAGKDDPRHLWPWIRQHVDTIRPSRCFFENVEGHISLGLREVISDLESLGYTTTWGIFSAAEVGAPHQRKRVYILANSNDASSEGRGVPGGVHQKYPQSNGSCDGVGREATQQWLPEPGLGRVVDGCPNRVDRLRLLGNAVVPQTAAKAWTILNRR
jgi:DNA (cytosine-5)-methyltransferase 1